VADRRHLMKANNPGLGLQLRAGADDQK
jgi:hypothetical protein